MVVEQHAQVQNMFGLRPIAKHDGDRAEYLHLATNLITLLHAHMWIPAIVLHLPKKLVIHQHACTARLVMLKPHKAAVAIFLLQIRPVFGENVRMDVDFQR